MTEALVVSVGHRDNVVIAVRPLARGLRVPLPDGSAVLVDEAIPFGHKLAIADIPEGHDVVKYDEVIGVASADISAGTHVHVHNVVSARLPGATEAARQ